MYFENTGIPNKQFFLTKTKVGCSHQSARVGWGRGGGDAGAQQQLQKLWGAEGPIFTCKGCCGPSLPVGTLCAHHPFAEADSRQHDLPLPVAQRHSKECEREFCFYFWTEHVALA